MKTLKKNQKLIEFLWSFAGAFLFAFGVNVIITPIGLYNGGFTGIAQLIRTVANNTFDFAFLKQYDITGIVYYIMNIPIFWWAWKEMGSRFLINSLITVTIQTAFMTFIPVPKVPVFIGDFVLANYGTGAVMAVPSHDQRDFEYAIAHNIDMIQVIDGRDVSESAFEKGDYLGKGCKLINSEEFTGLTVDEAKEVITDKLAK